jgi:hypothetical protein
MRLNLSRAVIAQIIFITGLLLMIAGVAFILGSLADISQKYILLAFLFIVVGAGIAFFAIKLNKRALYLFFATFFILIGLFLFLIALQFPLLFSQTWPLLSVFSGLALIPAGWRKYNRYNSKYMVPAVAFVVLGAVLLVFSFHIVSFHFKQFILNWWPLLVVLMGLLLVLLTLGSKNSDGKPEA